MKARYWLAVFAVGAILMSDAYAADKGYTITVDSMVKVLFTGDSQTTGRNLAIDFPQLVSRHAPVRVINTAVGGSNSDALLKPLTGVKTRVKKGERVLYGETVRWGTGPFPGMKVTVAGETYTIDHIVEDHKGQKAELHLCEEARADYEGSECSVEPGWEVRVARHKPDVVCLMYINDGSMGADRQANWREMLRRIGEWNAVPVLMSPVPVSDGAHGGGHPGYNPKVAENAKVVRELAREHKAWFVDVFGLYLALDPPFRGVVGDGIHPDTDGSTCIVNGLRWVFEQMGLMDARPHLKGWALTGPPAPLHDLLKSGVRPFRISQPDHPDPDHQSEAGFTLEAIRRNDEYGLIASRDGASLAVGQGLLFRCGLSRADGPQSVVLRLAGKGLTAAQVWGRGIAELANSAIGSSASRSRKPAEDRARAEAGGWGSIPLKEADGWLCGRIPLSAVEEGLFHVLVLGGKDAALDALAVDVEGAEPPALWKPREVAPSEYVLASDHLRSDNLLKNADFAAGDAEHWRLSGAARINRPFKAAVEGVSFVDEKDLRMAELATSAAVRPFDVIEMSGSAKGNDGPYRVRDEMGNGRWRMRKKAKAVESGLKGELRHNDGCGLVAGDCCVEVSGEGMASQRAKLPPSTRAVRLSFFYRVYDPKALGTRDVPPPCAKVKALFLDVNGRQAGSEWLVTDLPCSYQWQKAELERDAPNGAASVELTVQSASATVVQYTGFFAGRASRE